jgi:hypothetical protein
LLNYVFDRGVAFEEKREMTMEKFIHDLIYLGIFGAL